MNHSEVTLGTHHRNARVRTRVQVWKPDRCHTAVSPAYNPKLFSNFWISFKKIQVIMTCGAIRTQYVPKPE